VATEEKRKQNSDEQPEKRGFTMKKIIEGKRYDTTTAEPVASWDNGLSRSDFHNCEETLYLTKNGAWFIYGRGGAMSAWRKPVGNMWSGGGDIKVVSHRDAQAWLEGNGFDAEVEQYFSDRIQDA
jgi:hypothetical protein